MNNIKKEKNHAFGKDVYLLGINKYNEKVWLEQAKFDCNWYWGFGYIKIYTNDNPSKINSHSHWKDNITGKKNEKTNEYVHHINENLDFESTVLSDGESWSLSELMDSFYILRESAELFHMGGAHKSKNPLHDLLKNEEIENKINKELLPKLFEEIYKILNPEKTLDK